MRLHHILVIVATIPVCLAVASTSADERQPWTLESTAEEMLDGGAYQAPWRVGRRDNGSVVLRDGRLIISNGLPSDPGAACLSNAWPAEPKGRQVVETRLAISPKTRKDGFILGVCDGQYEECFSFLPDRVVAKRAGVDARFDTTKPTTYRLETADGRFTLFADGKKLLEGPRVNPRSVTGANIRIGGPSSSGAGEGAVEFVRYRVYRPDGSLVARGSGAYTRSEEMAEALADQPARIPVYLNWDFNCLVLSPEAIRELVRDAKEAGVDGLNLRISNKGALNFRSKAGEYYTERLNAFGPDYDPLRILVDECHKQGIKAIVWFDLFEAAYNRLIEKHPEFSPQGRPGKPHLSGFPCYSHAEVRDHMLQIVKEFADYQPDYVFFCTKSSHIPRNHLNQPHNRDTGFNPPVVETYKALYGVDPRTGKFDREKLGRIRGAFVIEFLKEAKKILNAAGIKTVAGATVSGRLQPAGANLYLDWREILKNRAADALLMANSRGEYYAFYDPAGQREMEEIRLACEQADVEFWPYIISSGTYQPIAAKVGFAGLLDYIPRQLHYLQAMGGQAILIHDLDLFSGRDRTIRRALWRAVGDRPDIASFPVGEPVDIPRVISLTKRYPGVVPQGDFEESHIHFWSVVPSIQNQLAGRVNWSFEQYVGKHERPAGWEFKADGPGVFGVYDWKVMHNDADSGRSWHGRSSMMIGVKPGEAEKGSIGRWTGRFSLEGVRRRKLRVTMHMHGEGLKGVSVGGLSLTSRTLSGELPRAAIVSPLVGGPAGGTGDTFPWHPYSVTLGIPEKARVLEIVCFLSVTDPAQAQGRIWCDGLLIEDAGLGEVPEAALRSEDAAGGRQCVRLEAAEGWDLTSVPFRIPKSEDSILKLSLRADRPQRVELLVTGAGKAATTVDVGREWQTFSLPLSPTDGKQDSRVLVRPLSSGILDIDELRIE